MNENNQFNNSNGDSFVRSKQNRTSSGDFGRAVLVPFLSGIVGASLVLGTCFGVPSIKSKLFSTGLSSTTSQLSTSSSNTSNLVDISNYSDTATAVASKVLPSVVGITVTYQINSIFGSGTQEGTGSGIIISEDGYILTNNHVVASSDRSSYYAIQEATGVKVNLYQDDQTYDATIVGTDAITDLAVLKIDKNGLIPATLGNSENVKVGEFVMAIGNPLGMDYSVTTGVVSALDRSVSSDGVTYKAIQTDAAINSGNSGGALVNANGEVIGINTMKLAGNGIEGIGFAIPISSTTNIINQLMKGEEVKRPYIGISGSSVEDTVSEKYNVPKGIYVEVVYEGSPAEKAGIQKGDIITKIEGKDVKSVGELNSIKYNYNIGDTVTLTIYKDGNYQDVKVTLVETPKEEQKSTNSNKEQSNDNSRTYVETIPNDDDSSLFDFFFR